MSGWRRSSFCNFGDCVEVNILADGGVAVRPSTVPQMDIRFTSAEWDAFVRGVKAGEFNLPEGDQQQ